MLVSQDIVRAFQADKKTAIQVACILNGKYDDDLTDYASVRQLYSYSDIPYMRLLAANELLADYGCFGVEGICFNPPESYANISYLNTGDTYSSTVIYDHDTSEFTIGCWGDFEESAMNEFDGE